MLQALLNTPCTIVRRTESGDIDAYGNEIPAETLVETTCELQQQRRDERDLAGELSDTRWLAILPAGSEIETGDVLIVDGHEYELLGDPWPVRNPRTRAESHIECTLRRTAGGEDAS